MKETSLVLEVQSLTGLFLSANQEQII